jgi:hypothetical protein
MVNLAKALAGLAGVAFIMAVVTNFTYEMGATAEGFSRASTNLALFATALVPCFGAGPADTRSR